MRPQSWTARYFGDARAAELGVDLDLDEVRAERAAHFPLHRRVRRRRRDQHVVAFRQPLLGDLLLQIARRFDDGVAGHDRGAAAGLADRVGAAIGVAPDHLQLRQRHAQFLGGNQPHRRLRAAADVGDADVHGVLALRINPDDRAAAAEAGAERHERHARSALDGTGVRPRLRLPARLPLERLGAAADALVEGVGGVRRLVTSLPRHVLQDELDRIHLQLRGDVVHHRLDAEEALRELGAAEISRHRSVRVDRRDRRLDVRALIQLDAGDVAGVLAVRPHPAVAAHLNRLQRAVALHAHLVVLRRRPAPVHADEVFLARQLQLHRRAGVLRQHRGDQIGVLVLVLVAEVAAHVAADDADFFLGDAEVARHVGAAVGDAAGRRVHRQLVGVPGGDADARLHLGVVDEGGRVAILEDVIRRREAFFYVAAFRAEGHGLVPRVRREIAFGPDLHGAGLQGFFRIEDERKRFILHRDELQRFFGDVPIDRGNRGHRLADEAHRVVERVAPVLGDLLDLFVVLRAAGDRSGAPDDRAVLVRDDGLHAGKRERLRRVDAADARVRVRTAQHARVEHAREHDVAGVGRLAGRRARPRRCAASRVRRRSTQKPQTPNPQRKPARRAQRELSR